MKALVVIILTAAILTHLTVVAIVAGSLALVPLAVVVGYRASGHGQGWREACADGAIRVSPSQLAAVLREVADDDRLLYEVARRSIEDALVEWRDDRLSMPFRNNGFVIKERDGEPSSVIRFGPEVGVRIALKALAEHYETGVDA